MKRVLIFIDSLGAGGAQRQIVGLAKLMKDRGHEIKLIYYHPLEFYKPYLDQNGIANECVSGASATLKRIPLVSRAVKTFAPDVVISYIDTPNIIACLLKIFGMRFRLIVSERNTTQALARKERIKFFLMRWADVVVPNSHAQEHFIANHYPDLLKKTVTITNFVDTDMFSPATAPERNRLRIICVARVTEQKNALRFMEVMKTLKEEGLPVSVDWYGFKIEPYHSQCCQRAKELQIEDIWHFHDPSQQIIEEYRNSDIFCLPSLYEGFPNVICEAMSCGKPVVCGDICDNGTIVKDGENGLLFDPHSVEDMTAKLRQMCTMPEEERTAMGHRSRQLALELFSMDVFSKSYTELVEQD